MADFCHLLADPGDKKQYKIFIPVNTRMTFIMANICQTASISTFLWLIIWFWWFIESMNNIKLQPKQAQVHNKLQFMNSPKGLLMEENLNIIPNVLSLFLVLKTPPTPRWGDYMTDTDTPLATRNLFSD